jgi:hypothetical protein
MLLEKQPLTAEELESQFALELPDREMMALVTVIITDVLNNNTVTIELKNINVAVQLCAIVELLDASDGDNDVTCTLQQKNK